MEFDTLVKIAKVSTIAQFTKYVTETFTNLSSESQVMLIELVMREVQK